jgi:predicted NAD-dependent protein-ADP-ribosyltransferase YbiA (DUF1768 family)
MAFVLTVHDLDEVLERGSMHPDFIKAVPHWRRALSPYTAVGNGFLFKQLRFSTMEHAYFWCKLVVAGDQDAAAQYVLGSGEYGAVDGMTVLQHRRQRRTDVARWRAMRRAVRFNIAVARFRHDPEATSILAATDCADLYDAVTKKRRLDLEQWRCYIV